MFGDEANLEEAQETLGEGIYRGMRKKSAYRMVEGECIAVLVKARHDIKRCESRRYIDDDPYG